jgi:transposase
LIHGANRHAEMLCPERLDDYRAAEHPVRFLEAFVDPLNRTMLGCQRATPAAPGRPAYAPADLWQLSLSGSLSHLRSSRRLDQETPRKVELMWVVKKLRPDHKTIADVRQHHLQPRRQVCRECTLLWKPLALCAGELVASDGSQCKAVNATERHCTQDKLTPLLPQIDQRLEGALQELDGPDHQDEAGTPGGAVADHGQAQLEARQHRKRR